MTQRPLRIAALVIAAAVELGACADILGFPDAELGTTGAGGGAACVPGATKPCYSGPEGTEGVGVCRGGTRACKADGSGFSDTCSGEVLPSSEDCAKAGDEDCSGLADGDDPACACLPGSNEPCYTGPQGTRDVGACQSGTMACKPDGKGYDACKGEVHPAFQDCAGTDDGDCDGAVACTGAHRWTRRFGDLATPAADQRAIAVAAPLDGRVIVVGSAGGTTDLGGAPAGGAFVDPFVVAVDARGAPLWHHRFTTTLGGAANAVAVDGAGASIVVGNAAGTVDFDDGNAPPTGGAGANVLVAKIDAGGTVVFGKLFGGLGAQIARGVAIDSKGDILVTGNFFGDLDFGCAGGPLTTAGAADVFVAKLSGATGGCVWQKRFGDVQSQISTAVAIDGSDDVAITGFYGGTLDFGGGKVITAPSASSMFVAKLSGATGNALWARSPTDLGTHAGKGIATDANGNVLVVGSFTSTLDLGGGKPGASNGGMDAFLAKLAPDGTLVDAMAFGGAGTESGEAIAIDPAGNITLAAYFTGPVSFGTGVVSPLEGTEAVVWKLDPTWGALWAKQLGGVGHAAACGEDVTCGEIPHGLAVGPLGQILVAMEIEGAVDFGGGVETTGALDAVVLELAP